MSNSKLKRGQNASSIALLQKLMPPRTMIHVGAGGGEDNLHVWHDWPLTEAWVIDADYDRLEWARNQEKVKSGWYTRCALLDEVAHTRTFHLASNPDEAGLLSPLHLRRIWPNLQSTGEEERSSQRLDALLAESKANFSDTWIFIDCFPALPILKGAGQWLEHCSVLWLRVLLKPLEATIAGATLEALEEYLHPMGFRCVDISESNHPAVGHALFVRDWQGILMPRLSELSKAGQDHQGAMLELVQKLEAQEKSSTDLQHLNLSLEQRSKELNQEVIELKQVLHAQGKLVGEKEAKIGRLVDTGNEQVALVARLQDEIAAVSGKSLVLAQENAQLAVGIEDLRQKAAAHTLEHGRQMELLGDLQQDHQLVAQAKADLEQELLALRMSAEDSQVELAAVAEMELQQRQTIAGLERQLDDSRLSGATQEQQNKELIARIADIELQLSAQKQETIAKVQALDDVQKGVDTSGEIKIILEQENKILQLRVDESQKKLLEQNSLRQELSSTKEAVRILELQKAELEQLIVQAAARESAFVQESKLAGEKQARIEELQQAIEVQSVQIAEQVGFIESSNQSKAAFEQTMSVLRDRQGELERELSAVKQTNEELSRLADERHNRVTQLEIELSEWETQQQMLFEEMTRAEGQIDLIKDVLLRESGL